MPFDRFMIAPFNSGIQADMKPWLIAEDAFQTLSNAYCWRGRITKRFGSEFVGNVGDTSLQSPLFNRLRILIGTTSNVGNLSGTVPGTLFAQGQLFSIGDVIYTVSNSAAGAQATLLSTPGTVTHTYNITNGAYVFVGAPINTPVYFYPADSVQTITNYESGYFNDFPAIAFDTQFAYIFAGGGWNRLGTAQWHGTNLDFYWCWNWVSEVNLTLLFISNFNYTLGAPGPNDDPMYYYDGAVFTVFQPLFSNAPNQAIITAQLIVPFKNRLLLLGTVEQDAGGNNVLYQQRVRYSAAGSPTNAAAYIENDDAGYIGGGYVDATTTDAIVSLNLFRNRLIVYFTNSVWELVYTGIDTLPFAWQQLNSELGCESPYSVIPFDQFSLAMGSVGIHSCNGVQVQRIDDKIPNAVFEILQTAHEPSRVKGIRDYYLELAYWSVPFVTDNLQATWPSAIIVYNYVNQTWATFNDSITAFGYFYQQDGPTWTTYGAFPWEDLGVSWDSGQTQANQRTIIAGNQEGFIFGINPVVQRNAPSLQVTNIVSTPGYGRATIINHNLAPSPYLHLENMNGILFPERGNTNSGIFEVDQVIDINTVLLTDANFTGTYNGGGTAALVSQVYVVTKDFNPYVDKARNFYIHKIDFGVNKTSEGELTIDYVLNQAEGLPMIEQGINSGAIMGNNILETSPYALIPWETFQQTLWHPIYFQTDGEFIQIQIFLNEDQIIVPAIVYSDFTLQGMILYTMPTASRLQ